MRRSKELKKRDIRRKKRKLRVRFRVLGSSETPRVSIKKTNRYLIVQAIDDTKGHTLAFINSGHLEEKIPANKEGAKKVGELFAAKLKEANITAVKFDRNGYKYHGVVAVFADTLRENGIKL
jgi:large subunit ribosomal protein L18